MTTMKAKKEQHPKMLPCWQSHGVHSLEPVFAYFNSMKGFAILIPTWLHRRLELIFAIQLRRGSFEILRFAQNDRGVWANPQPYTDSPIFSLEMISFLRRTTNGRPYDAIEISFRIMGRRGRRPLRNSRSPKR